jgi:alcohol dehydrogenase class IV
MDLRMTTSSARVAGTITAFSVRTEVVTGPGSRARLSEVLARHGAAAPAVAVDAALVDNGVLDLVLSRLAVGVPIALLAFPPDPDVAVVEKAVERARDAGADSVLAVGGGSALGAGKAVAIRLTNGGSIADFEGANRVPRAPAPVIAVPTTAGSGSEVSTALVLHEPGRPNELVVQDPAVAPRAAVLDGELLRALPERPLLYAALDALTHAMEALWARRRSSFSTALARDAAERIIRILPIAMRGAGDRTNCSGANDDVLQNLLEASCAANMACGNSGLGLVHALSSSPAVHLPHGLQNGILLPHVGAFNRPVLGKDARRLLVGVDELYARIDFAPEFRTVTDAAVPGAAMLRAAAGHPFRANNLRSSTDVELERILAAAGAAL